MKRRELLAALAVSPFVASCGPGNSTSTSTRIGQIGQVGIQLYTVRDRMADDVPATLQHLADIGYREVEFAGYYGHSPAEIAALVRNAGLTAPAAHIGMASIREAPDKSIDDAAAIGHEYLVLSSMPMEERTGMEHFRRNADLMNAFGEQCRAGGLQFAYHNHAFEFDSPDGNRPMDLLLERTDSELVKFELDLYWIIKAGSDPIAYIQQHPGRFALCHVKDMADDGSMVEVGAGQIDFARILSAGREAGFRHYFVEHDNPVNSMASAQSSFEFLSKLEF